MNYEMTSDMEISEAIRWCYRHHACVDFYGDVNEPGRWVYMRIATPVRGEVDCHTVTVRLPGHDQAAEAFVEIVSALRDRLGYE